MGFGTRTEFSTSKTASLYVCYFGIAADLLTDKAFGELSTLITKEAHKQGFIKASDLDTIDAAKADSLSDHASILWGTNARTRSAIAQKNLGWKPIGVSLETTIPDLVQREGKALVSEK